jgi:ribonuclease J
VETHTSGHIFAEDIVSFLRAINPALVIPIHTFEPERFHNHFPNALVLQDGQILALD